MAMNWLFDQPPEDPAPEPAPAPVAIVREVSPADEADQVQTSALVVDCR